MNETESDTLESPAGILEKIKPYIRFIYERISDIVCVFDSEGRIRLVNPSFERQFGYFNQDIKGVALQSLIMKDDLEGFNKQLSLLVNENKPSLSFDIHIRSSSGDYRDLTGRITNRLSDPDLEGILLIASDTTEQRRWETILGQYSHRLEVMRKIQNGILQAESPQSISKVALDLMNSIIPCSMASITLFEKDGKSIHLLATVGGKSRPPNAELMVEIDDIQMVLKQGRWFEIGDIAEWTGKSPLFDMMMILGMKKLFFIPLLIRGNLIGSLNLAFRSEENVGLDHLEAAREIADMLALAIQQSNLLESEQRQRQQAEMIRDAISSIATSLDFQQVVADLLTNLRLLVSYDSARVVLIEDESLRVAASYGFPSELEVTGKRHSKQNLIFEKMRQTRQPIVISDTQKDKRFTPWEGQEDIRSWMGVPLVSHNGMIGYLSLNSKTPAAFDRMDLAPVLVFADHVAVTLENAWLYDQTDRRARELSAISRVSTSLRNAKNLRELLITLLKKTLEAVDIQHGSIYHIEENDLVLSAAVGQAEGRVGWRTNALNNLFLENLKESRSVTQVQELEPSVIGVWKKISPPTGRSSNTIFVPLITTDGLVGLMCLEPEKTTNFDSDCRKIVESIGDMASNALYRVLIMGELENRVKDQTRDLTVLYEVSAITSQPLGLNEMLSLSLDRLLPFTNNSLGVIYQLQADERKLHKLVERRLPESPENTPGGPSSLPIVIDLDKTGFFIDPLSSGIPHLIPDLNNHPLIPAGFNIPDLSTYTGIPIKCKGKMLGMLCLFTNAEREVSIEQMTLLSAIGDQIGVAIDSSDLRRRAAEAAVFEERQRLARDLHDSVTQSLYSMTLLAEGYRRQVPNGTSEEIQVWLEDLESVSLQALKEMRLLLYELKPASFQEDGLLDALNRRLQSVESRSGMKVNFSVKPRMFIPPVYQEELYRIAQEALNNVIKHSGANTVHIRLENEGNNILLEIEDNGKGFIPSAAIDAGGIGLAGMSERASRLGGSLEIQSNLDSGTKVRVSVPGGQS